MSGVEPTVKAERAAVAGTAGGAPGADPTMERLESQIAFYSSRSGFNQKMFKRLKVIEVVAAAAIPFFAALQTKPAPSFVPWLTGGLGLVVTILEGLQHLNQYQHNWIAYRSTAEGLKHEKYLYLAQAGPYTAATNPHALLAERIESLLSQEHTRWASEREASKPKGTSS